MENIIALPNDAAAEAKKIDWESMVSAWKSSRLTRKEFCEQHQLNHNQFLYQRVKYDQKRGHPPEWLSVQQSEKKSSASPATGVAPMVTGFLLKTPQGHQLSIPAGADAPTLKILLAFMRESTC
jgi:hypothetical protein